MEELCKTERNMMDPTVGRLKTAFWTPIVFLGYEGALRMLRKGGECLAISMPRLVRGRLCCVVVDLNVPSDVASVRSSG